MNPQRRLLWLGGLVMLLLIMGGGYYLWPRCPVRYDNFAKVTDDMTLAEVEALMGCPPGDYRTGEVEYTFDDINFPPLSDTEARWQGDQGDIVVFRDDMERIVAKMWIKGEPEGYTKTMFHWLIDRMRR